MLLPSRLWPRIESGEVTVAFRWWRRPTVRTGSTLRTAAGVLAIDGVEVIEPGAVTSADAEAAGAASVAEAIGTPRSDDRRLHRIRFHRVGEDPRIGLRDEDLDAVGRDEVGATLDEWDRRSRGGPWTRRYLALIAEQPGVVASVLAEQVGEERLAFKRRVRRLKELGLTESLSTGYRLSTRGEGYLRREA